MRRIALVFFLAPQPPADCFPLVSPELVIVVVGRVPLIAPVEIEKGLNRVELFDVLNDLFDEGPFFLMNDEVGGKGGAREMWVVIGGGMDDSVNFRPADVPVTRKPNALGGCGSS